MIEIKVAKVRDYTLNEDKVEILIERNYKRYEGALFFEQIGKTRICKTYEVVQIAEDIPEREIMIKVFKAYLYLCDKYNLKYYKTTLSTMMHWSYVNGLSDYMFNTWNSVEFNEIIAEIGRKDQVSV